MKMRLKIWTDGSGDGRICYVTEDGTTKVDRLFNLTNNQAEYRAIIMALKYCARNRKYMIEIISDSKLVIHQLNHEWHIKDEKMRELAMEVWNMIKSFNLDVKFTWKPREENRAGKVLG